MLRIAVIGANSQVGAEVSLYLARTSGVHVTGFVRSEYGAVLLRRFGITCVTGPFVQESLVPKLRGFDIVADFTYPAGQLPELPKRIYETMSAVVNSMSPGSRYVYMSSIQAFGMSPNSRLVQRHRVCRSSYARVKRLAEKWTVALTQCRGVYGFVFRLGQVHGLLQSVSQETIDELTWHEIYVQGHPEDLTTTVFAAEVASALLRTSDCSISPGIYTAVSSPQWTLKQLYRHYQMRYLLSPIVHYNATPRLAQPTSIRQRIVTCLLKSRGVLEAYVLLRSPRVFRYLKGAYRTGKFSPAIEIIPRSVRFVHHLLGRVPPPCVAPVDSSPEWIAEQEIELSIELDRHTRAAD